MSRRELEQPIDYRWLNLEAERFEDSRHRLDDALRVGHEGPLYFRAIVSPQRSQVLIAGARRDFTDSEAIRMARRLSGLGITD